jgi:hypothetical protein
MDAMISSVRKMPCSMVVMPASTASAMAEPCVRGGEPSDSASSTPARISSSVSCGEPGSILRRHHAAVAMSDDIGALALMLAHGPADVIKPVGLATDKLPWPPVMHRAPGRHDPRTGKTVGMARRIGARRNRVRRDP